MEDWIAMGLELLGAVAGFLFVLRTALAGIVSGARTLAVRLDVADMRDGRRDWHWTRSLGTFADVLGAAAESIDGVLDALPVRGLRRK